MKASKECRSCLDRLARQAAEMAAPEGELRARALEAGLKVVEEHFSTDDISIKVATRLHRAVRAASGNPDPYREMKDKEIELARSLYTQMGLEDGCSLADCVALAASGNALDFFRGLEAARADMGKAVEFAIGHISFFEKKLQQAKRILYLGDNAGEVFFDLPLVAFIQGFGQVTYVVKASPVQNDSTLEDLRKAGVMEKLGHVMTTGTDTPGVDLSIASPEFKQEFKEADLVVAKGMGYYETLSELPAEGRVFYCLKAKCPPVASSLGVPLDSYVAMLR